uniref:Antimicrobial peptide type 1 n=1 Tax=Pandalus japonicus TaxID=666362 RepID=I6ZAW5_PANJP|nr:antimicrobial peptide type 1 precursor [Pandalus japonicus]
MVRLLILVALVAVATASPRSPIPVTIATPAPDDCVQWCNNPILGSSYCCNDGNGPQFPIEVHPGKCREHRPFCPKSGTINGPGLCAHDGYCRNPLSKCCFDTCLGHHTCTPAIIEQVPL